MIDFSGQAVSALGRLYRAAQLPTLIVWGARDPFIPVSHALAAHNAIPGSRLEIFDGVGHYPHCEAPERFVAVLTDFIASTKPARLMRDPLTTTAAVGPKLGSEVASRPRAPTLRCEVS